jgi:hypothetical protein
MNQPIKRSDQLRYFSHDHHDGLLLCLKIAKGLSMGIDPDRIILVVHQFPK